MGNPISYIVRLVRANLNLYFSIPAYEKNNHYLCHAALLLNV